MPGAVQKAAPSAVLPQNLCVALARAQEYLVLENEYPNGESQRAAMADRSRKSWRLSKWLTSAQPPALWVLLPGRPRANEPFYFYDPWETVAEFSYDPTGVSPVGRFAVRFQGNWSESVGMSRADVCLDLSESA